MKKYAWYLFFFLLFALLGFGRDFFFVNLNTIMYHKYYERESVLPTPDIMRVFMNFSYGSLYYSKYVYTLICTFLYFSLSYFALKKLCAGSYLLKILFYAYLLILLLAAVLMLFGYFFQQRLQDDEYTMSRWLMGIAQSPVICLILLASEKLYRRSVTGGGRK